MTTNRVKTAYLRNASTTLALAGLAGLAMPYSAQSAVFEVNDKTDFSDQNPGDGVCNTGNFRVNLPPFSVIPECTFRAALEEANALPGPDEIRFSSLIPLTASFAEFTPFSPFPAISDEILINGYSHPDYDAANADGIPTPVVQLIGNSVPDETVGLDFQPGSDGSTLFGVAIHQFPADGIRVGAGLSTPGPVGLSFQGNHLGAARGGFMFGNGGNGLRISSGSSMNTIGNPCTQTIGCLGRGNLISANTFSGVFISGSNNRVAGNYIGTDSTGFLDFVPFGGTTGNRGAGVFISFGAANNEIGSLGAINFGGIGGPTPVAAGNVISANGNASALSGAAGIYVNEGSTGTTIKANRIGTSVDGMALLSNERYGIELWGEATIGDTGLGSNLIAGLSNLSPGIINASAGIFSIGNAANLVNDPFPVTVIGNQIGINAAGNQTLGDLDAGMLILFNRIRGAVDDNVVGGSGTGIVALNADVRRNYLGTNAAGDDLGNLEFGIEGSSLAIGGDLSDSAAVAASKGNIIAFSADAGIGANSTSGGLTVRGNRFRSNGSLPFDLGPEPIGDPQDPANILPPDGPTANDIGDLDLGPNQLQNFPEFNPAQTRYDSVADEITVRLRVDSLPTSATYPLLVDVYARNPYADPQDQVGFLIGSFSIEEVNAGVFVTESFTPLPGAFDPDPVFGTIFAELSAVATSADGGSSEFSRESVPVPEPEFAGLMALGIAFLGMRRRKSMPSSAAAQTASTF